MLGRKVANTGFLTALLEADPFESYHFFLENADALARQEAWLRETFPALYRRGAFACNLHQEVHHHLARTRYHAFHLSDCLTRPVALARLRNLYSRHIFPITGPTHSLSYERFMPAYLAHLWPGACARDAIVATSKSAETMLRNTFAGLREDWGLPKAPFGKAGASEGAPGPRLARIPLGVPAQAMPAAHDRWDAPPDAAEMPAATDTARQKAAAFPNMGSTMRARLGLGREVVFLCLARISPASKMDVLPALAAMKRAQATGLADAVLLLAGWAEEGDPLPEALTRYAAALGVRLMTFLRPSDEECRALYAAADVFLSPSDNIQETFGLTLAEAGAAGLPVIASDFDGYRETVVHEETGLLVPTLGFAGTEETNALAALWFDNQYHLKLAQQSVVDVPSMAGAMLRLGSNAALRRRMGEAARERIRAHFSWERIIPHYVALWEELAATPLAEQEEARLRGAVHPLGMDFARSFAGHYTRVLDDALAETLVLRRTTSGDALYRREMPPLLYAGLEHMLDDGMLRRVLLAARRSVPAKALLEAALPETPEMPGEFRPAPGILRERASFTVLWALKQDYLEIVE